MDEKNCCDTLPWLTLVHAQGLSFRNCIRLLEIFSHPENIILAEHQLLKSAGLDEWTIKALHKPEKSQLEAALSWLEIDNNHLITLWHPDYPELLKHISDPPVALFARGDLACLKRKNIAVIGSRKPTPGGNKIAYEFASSLSANGITVTSGLAYGIDTSAHSGALTGSGGSIAVLGSGLDCIYPKRNINLAQEIADRGLLLSEFPLQASPLPRNFPRRNRIISGMSLGVLVVEASLKSGSLITANLAAEQGREVFVIPGSILNPVAAGCNKLISNGAKLTTNIQDIVEEIPGLGSEIIQYYDTKRISQVDNEILDEQVKLLLDNIGYEPVSFENIVAGSGLSIEKIRVMLPELELEGMIQSVAGGRYVKK